jgi:citrate synthase
MPDTLTVKDNRTGRTYEIPITHGAIRATDLQQIKVSDEDLGGVVSYDPAFLNTASCISRITYIDGERGVLLYRGYPIEELAEKSSFLETAYLLIHGELPTREQYGDWTHEITMHTLVHENLKRFIDGFHHDAHPMGMLLSTVGALATFYPEATHIHDAEQRRVSLYRLIAKMPTLAALAYRHSKGFYYVRPDNELSYAGNFLNMMFKMVEQRYQPVPEIERALDVLFILHADHEQNCSTNAMRSVGSSHPDPYSAAAAAIAALYGQHGGTDEAVLRMLEQIGSAGNIPDFIRKVKAGEEELKGFGHQVYRKDDPRARVMKRMAHQVFSVTESHPLLDVALELETIALED